MVPALYIYSYVSLSRIVGWLALDFGSATIADFIWWRPRTYWEWINFDSSETEGPSVKLNQRLNKIFDKKVGVNQLRHTFLTDKYAHTISDKEDISNTMATMGSSSNMLDTYVKK